MFLCLDNVQFNRELYSDGAINYSYKLRTLKNNIAVDTDVVKDRCRCRCRCRCGYRCMCSLVNI